MSIVEKIEIIAKEIYRASNVQYSEVAKKQIEELESKGFSHFPICVAKTQYSFSDNSKFVGSPTDFTINVRDVKLYNGAHFITIFLGDVMIMPGLSKKPNYENIDLNNGEIVGLY